MARIQYRPEIDGLRAVAVLAVMLFHLDIGLSGGFIGVDVFFVISGFLITSIIIADLKTGSFSLKTFWMKRLRRLVPASFVMLIGTLLGGWFLFLPAEFISVAQAQLAQVVLFANYHFAYRIDYFDPIAGLNPLLHSWSLAVEEHFYLLLPIILLVLFRRGIRSIWLSLSALLVISLVYSIWQVGDKPELAFYLLPSRAWELLIGCCLANSSGSISDSSKLYRLRSLISYVSAVALFFCFWSYDHSTAFPGLNAVIPCLATAGLIYGTQSTNLIARFLKLRVMVGIGLISYSLYLWHWPVIVFTKLTYASEFTPLLSCVLFFVCFLLAFLSWRFVEQPFRKCIWLSTPKSFLLAMVTLGTTLILISLVIMQMDGLPGRYEKSLRPMVFAKVSERFQIGSASEIRRSGLPKIGLSSGEPRFLLWGDSHTAAISEMVHEASESLGLTGYIASRNATPPLLQKGENGGSDQQEWNDAVFQVIQQQKIKNVIIVASWRDTLTVRLGKEPKYKPETFQQALHYSIDQLSDLGINVWVMEQIPTQQMDISRVLINAKQQALPIPFGITKQQYDENQKTAHLAFERYLDHPNVSILNVAPFCFVDGKSVIGNRSETYYADQNHLSKAGAETIVQPVLLPVLKKIKTQMVPEGSTETH